MIRFLFLFLLFYGTSTAIRAIPQADASSTASSGAGTTSPRAHDRTVPPSLWGDSKKLVEQGGSDVGGWLVARRALLVEASVRNPYFWFCVVSLGLIALLTLTLYFERLSEHRKIWKATAAMTDLWNWALYADVQARQAVNRYNQHIDGCNRLVDLELSGKAPVRSGQDEEASRLHGEVEFLRRDKTGLEAQLAEKEKTIQSLTIRVDEIARQVAGGAPPADATADMPMQSRVQAQLMEKINQLSSRNQQLERDLEEARQKVARFSEERAPAC